MKCVDCETKEHHSEGNYRAIQKLKNATNCDIILAHKVAKRILGEQDWGHVTYEGIVSKTQTFFLR
jgi:hypothetical protein